MLIYICIYIKAKISMYVEEELNRNLIVDRNLNDTFNTNLFSTFL